MKDHLFKKVVAITMLVATFCVTTPVSAAELTNSSSLGSVTAVGDVSVRGVNITQDGTVFAGDKVAVGSKGSARIILVNGRQVIMNQGSELTVSQTTELRLSKGNVAINGKTVPINIVAGNYTIKGDKALSGDVAFVGSEYVGLRVHAGQATVENTKTKTSYKVSAGEERMFSLNTDSATTPVRTASSIPTIPATPSIPTQPRALSKGGTIALVATLAGAGAAIAFLATKGDKALVGKGTVESVVATAKANATTAATTATQITTATAATNTAIANSNLSAAAKAALQSQASTITSNAQATQTQIANINAQLASLQTQLGSATDQASLNAVATAINNLITQLNTQTAILNSQITALNTLVSNAQAQGVQGINTPGIATIPTTGQVPSGSVPGQ